MPAPIDVLCLDPVETRRLASVGVLTPCYRCLGFRPNSETGCFFLEIETHVNAAPEPQPEVRQSELFPTSDTMIEDDL